MNYSSTTDDFVDSASLLPYPSFEISHSSNKVVAPLSIGLTEFHFLLLYQDRVAAICNLNEELVYEEMIPLVRLKQSRTF